MKVIDEKNCTSRKNVKCAHPNTPIQLSITSKARATVQDFFSCIAVATLNNNSKVNLLLAVQRSDWKIQISHIQLLFSATAFWMGTSATTAIPVFTYILYLSLVMTQTCNSKNEGVLG